MNKLPTEVIVQIASHLPISNELNLAGTNKRLHKILTEDTLYSSLVFKNTNQYNQAIDLNKKKAFGHLVRNLRIKMMDYISEVIIALPTVFPRVRRLYLNALKSYSTSINFAHKKTKALIASIHNAPSLEKVTLSHILIKLEDLEVLHRNALHLNFVKLDRIYIYNADTGALTGINRAQNIKGFCLRIFDKEPGTTVEGQTWENVLVNWISYIGNKYTQLGDLKLSVDKDNLYVENPELLSVSLVSLLHNLRHINSYVVNVIPLPQMVLDTMNANGAQLNHLMIPLKFDDPIEESFNNVMAAPSTSTLPS